jgi:hypothetical protein
MWVFGDSFSRHFKYQPETWVERTSKIIGQEVKAFSRPVVPLEHIFYKFNEKRNDIKTNDIIIYTLTNLDRRWFWKNQLFKVFYEWDENETRAVNYYQRFLTNFNDVHEVYLINFLYNLHALTKKLNLHTIVIANFSDYDMLLEDASKKFPLFHFSKGPLSIAADLEWKKEVFRNADVEWFMRQDKRLNHFTKANHILISDKIIDNIKNKTSINFTQGLKTNFLDDDMLENPEFRKHELFNDEWKATVNSGDWKVEEE